MAVVDRKQYNVGLTDDEIKEIESAVVGVLGGVAVRVAALSWARAMQHVTFDPVRERVQESLALIAQEQEAADEERG